MLVSIQMCWNHRVGYLRQGFVAQGELTLALRLELPEEVGIQCCVFCFGLRGFNPACYFVTGCCWWDVHHRSAYLVFFPILLLLVKTLGLVGDFVVRKAPW